MKFFNFIINSNIFISLAAVFLTLETQLQLGMIPQLHPYLFLIFFATFFDYNLHRLITIYTNPDALNEPKHLWVKNNHKAFYVLVFVSVIGLIISALFTNKFVLVSLFPIGIITMLYSFPIYKTKKTLFRLREVPCLKLFLIAAVWSATTILLPVFQSDAVYNHWHIATLLIERFIFVFAIAIPFDIRDMEADNKAGLKTIPLIIGEKKSMLVANVYLAIFLILCFLHYYNTKLAFLLPAFIISAISTFLILNSTKLQKHPNYHYLFLDGTMLAQGLLACICYFFIYA